MLPSINISNAMVYILLYGDSKAVWTRMLTGIVSIVLLAITLNAYLECSSFQRSRFSDLDTLDYSGVNAPG